MPQTISDLILKKLNGESAHVDINLSEHPLVSSESVLIAARTQSVGENGILEKSGGRSPTMKDFTAIGVVQAATVQQQKNLQQLYELGSNQLYVLPGRTTLGASLSRVFIDGQSLLRALYGEDSIELGDAGFNNVVINLSSNLLNNPFDLLFLFFNHQFEPLGGFYLEDAYAISHQITLNTQQTAVLENISLLASRIVSMSTG